MVLGCGVRYLDDPPNPRVRKEGNDMTDTKPLLRKKFHRMRLINYRAASPLYGSLLFKSSGHTLGLKFGLGKRVVGIKWVVMWGTG